MQPFTSKPAHRNGLPVTGQTTVYVAGDNGTNQAGVAHRYEVKNTGQYSGTTAIVLNSKTDTHTNAVVIDHAFRVMYSQVASASVGPTSNGLLPWTNTGSGATLEGASAYVAAANAANVGGHNDWRLPTDNEMVSIRDMEAPNGLPDATFFPSWAAGSFVWSSTTRPNSTTGAMQVGGASGLDTVAVKTTTMYVALIRSI